MSKVSQPKKTSGSETTTKKATSASEDLAVSMTIVETDEKSKASKSEPVAKTAAAEKTDTTISFEAIQEQAFYLWEKGGFQHGFDEDHWLQAETTLKQGLKK